MPRTIYAKPCGTDSQLRAADFRKFKERKSRGSKRVCRVCQLCRCTNGKTPERLKSVYRFERTSFSVAKGFYEIGFGRCAETTKAAYNLSLQAEVSFTELPDVSADRELVEKLLFQLIDNALKFRKKDKKPVIDIGYEKFEGNVIFCVRDNGIGISKKYYHKIFELFEKLNRVDEYPGNGLGLAISRKITELHGGEIWVESLPGSGSNFYFTLRGK